MSRLNDQVACRHCGRHFTRRGLPSHERHCDLASQRSVNTDSLCEAFTLNSAFNDPCRFCGRFIAVWVAAFIFL